MLVVTTLTRLWMMFQCRTFAKCTVDNHESHKVWRIILELENYYFGRSNDPSCGEGIDCFRWQSARFE